MELAVPVIPADDVSEAKQFYVNKLGFQLTFETKSEGTRGMIGVKRGSMEITIDAPMDGHGRRASRDEYWGARTFGLQDPSDNTIFVIGPLPK